MPKPKHTAVSIAILAGPARTGSRITLTAVFGGDVPDAVKHAILVFIDAAYHARENPARENWTVMDALLCNHRRGA